MKLGLIGRGKAARTLAPLLEGAGFPLSWWWSRGDSAPEPETLARADVLLFAVSDGAIEDAGQTMLRRPWAKDEVWLHLSGSRPGQALRLNTERPNAVGAMHPLQALPGEDAPSTHLEGVIAGVDGEPEAVACATALAKALGMKPVMLNPDQKAVYHAAAVSVAGHATALFSQAMQMMAAAGFNDEDARDALAPLMKGALANLERGLPSDVITGPIARGDSATVVAHLRALALLPEGVYDTYITLAQESLALSRNSLNPAQLETLSKLLTPRGSS